MASCDDDFGLLGDDTHLDPPHPPQPPHQPSFYVPQKPLPPPASCFADDAASHFAPPAHDDNPGRKSSRHHPKRRGAAEDFSYGGDGCSYINSITGGQGSKKGRGMPAAADYRKDREDWSEGAIGSLLDAYTERFEQLNRGNLRGRDWEDVAAAVSGQLPHNAGDRKSVEQCKNKIDNLKKRYKVECQRAACGSVAVCHWPWFKKMEHIVGNSASASASASTPKPLPPDDDKPRHQQQQNNSRRYPPSGAGNLSVVVAGSRMTPLLNPRWKRVLLKIGGTTLAGAGPHNVDPMVIMLVAREVQVASRHGVEVAVAVGGRNAFCGETWSATTGTDRAATYPIGMMASLMNAVLLQASLEKIGVETRVQTALMMQEVAEPYTRRRAIRHLEKGRVVIFGGIGSVIGNPLLTTDTAAALRASEINADVILKGTAGDNLYGCPRRNSNTPFEHISFSELAARGFSMMDMTTITFCEENNISVVVFNMFEPGNISRALCGDQLGTLIDQSGRIS